MTNELRTALDEGNDAKALALIEAMPSAEREQFTIAAQQADLLGLLGRHDEELAILDRLVSDNPTNPGLHLSIANALKTVGRRDEAIESARRALALRPGYGKAWWVLAELKTFLFSAEDVEAMEQAMAAPQSDPDTLHLQFALGRAYEQGGETERAFAAYAAGNSLVAAAMPPEAGRVTERIDRTIANFTPDFFAQREGFGVEAADPIFVVGLHRSGSTLVEQVLASHPLIEATAELPLIDQLMRSVARDESLPGDKPVAKLGAIDANYARALGAQYLERARDYRRTLKPRFVDKLPANWMYVGFIQLILPNATIIDVRRHPMAAGFSNYRQHYGRGAGWSCSLETIGRYYRDYLRLMRHFDELLPAKVHHVVYEKLIEDFEPEVRRLLAHVGVEFEPACLEFHRSGRPVRSASAEQVRRPVNRDGVDQWRAFEPWLGPLQAALGDTVEDWQR